MAAKDFTPRQNEILIIALTMYVNSFNRRVNNEKELDAQAIWQKKIDEATVLSSKIRLT